MRLGHGQTTLLAALLYSRPSFAWAASATRQSASLRFLEPDDTARQQVSALIWQDEEFTLLLALLALGLAPAELCAARLAAGSSDRAVDQPRGRAAVRPLSFSGLIGAPMLNMLTP
jgi:hypothetical protein